MILSSIMSSGQFSTFVTGKEGENCETCYFTLVYASTVESDHLLTKSDQSFDDVLHGKQSRLTGKSNS